LIHNHKEDEVIEDKIGAVLPLDVRSRVEGLFSLVSDIGTKVKSSPVFAELLRDYQEMAMAYILTFEERLQQATSLSAGEKWLKRHEMLDKLTREWQLIYSLAAATELGASALADFQKYVDQAAIDIGLVDDQKDFLLIPTFGENFSLVRLNYSSSDIAILNLPISVIHSPWELSVIWHELAGLKVVKIREQINEFLVDHAKENKLTIPKRESSPASHVILELFDRIAADKPLDKDFKKKVKEFLSVRDRVVTPQDETWSQDWFEQLYEDACSVFAFGKDFVSVLERILSRQAHRLAADRKHPDLKTRIQVAQRLLARQEGNARDTVNVVERLTDTLLWAFIKEKQHDPISALPVAFSNPREVPEVRHELIDAMRGFNEQFGSLADGTIHEEHFDFGPMLAHIEKASASQYAISDEERTSRVEAKLLKMFENPSIESLLDTPFSPIDELDYANHTHQGTVADLYLGRNSSNHGAHHVLHFYHG
jgi:hypothetical protein